MQIFNVQIFGSDKEQWLLQTVEEKVEWIRKYTNQQNDAIIEEFVNNPKISKDKICLTCGLDKSKEEVKEVVEIAHIENKENIESVEITPISKKHKRK